MIPAISLIGVLIGSNLTTSCSLTDVKYCRAVANVGGCGCMGNGLKRKGCLIGCCVCVCGWMVRAGLHCHHTSFCGTQDTWTIPG